MIRLGGFKDLRLSVVSASRFLKGKGLWLTLGIGGIAVAGALLWRHYAQVRSIQAFINGEITYVRAPIPGKLSLNTKLQLGYPLAASEVIGTVNGDVENPRVSQLKITQQELRTRLQINQQQLDGLNQRLANRARLLQRFSQADRNQQRLVVDYSKAQVKQFQDELNRAKAAEEIAQADAKRYSALLAEGAVDTATAQRRMADAKQASAAVKAAQSQLEQAQFNVQAASAGLQLDGPRTFSYPEIRMIEIQTEITDLEQQAADMRRQVQSTQAELAKVNQELQTQKTVPVRVPEKGVVWSIDAQPGENVAANAPIMQLLNCNNVWVEAFVNESDANALSIGQPVEVQLMGTNTTWSGHIQTIRAGTGRVTVGQHIAEPPPEVARRQLPVRVVAARVKVDWPDAPSSEQFCRAGRSVEVRFPKKLNMDSRDLEKNQ